MAHSNTISSIISHSLASNRSLLDWIALWCTKWLEWSSLYLYLPIYLFHALNHFGNENSNIRSLNSLPTITQPLTHSFSMINFSIYKHFFFSICQIKNFKKKSSQSEFRWLILKYWNTFFFFFGKSVCIVGNCLWIGIYLRNAAYLGMARPETSRDWPRNGATIRHLLPWRGTIGSSIKP